MKHEGLAFIDGFWGVRIPDEYRFFSDFFCNYIGFQSRSHFEKYMQFYIPFIHKFFDDDWKEIRDPEIYVRRRNVFREEKPFSLYLEMVSHMFLYKNDILFAGISYNGIYDVDERNKKMNLLKPFFI